MTDEELHLSKMECEGPGARYWALAEAELQHRDRQRQKQQKRNWIGIFSLGLAGGGIIASAWPYIVWWVKHGFRFH